MGAFYFDTLLGHQETDATKIYGYVSTAYSNHHLDQKKQQSHSWIDTIKIFKKIHSDFRTVILDLDEWTILYEYKIPRRAKRIDVTLLSKNLIFVIEVKNHQTAFLPSDVAQLEDYCLDLRDFHFESKDKTIIPILLCTDAPTLSTKFQLTDDLVKETVFANSHNVGDLIIEAYHFYSGLSETIIDAMNWNTSKYSPTPTIIEAAQTLYSGQNVAEIARSHAGAENLTNTTSAVLDAIKEAQNTNSKIICFITGVPGAGKTLAGLNIVHNREFQTDDGELGVFLSGNSPLVKVLSEALARDFSKREKINKPEAKRRVKTFIHNVHEFIDEYYDEKDKLPVDRVLIYDEAQRAWTKEHKSRKSNGLINESEPEILLSIMNRFSDWGVVIALVGGGQEINTGEAGLREWGKSIETKFSDWKVYVSPELKQGDHSTGNLKLFDSIPSNVEIIENKFLHLNVSIRSYKAKELSEWVALVLENKPDEAKIIYEQRLTDYPLYITRDINLAKDWLRQKARGTRRTGIVASSGGRRLKAAGYDPFHGLRGDSSQDELGAWYLNSPEDVRSSNFLEILATEYAVQGLEIDWVGVFWDADLRRENGNWDFKQFKGTKWQKVNDEQRKQFILNTYRVLLTRAREGMIIWLPNGDGIDSTRLPVYYNLTFEYLIECGINVL